MEHLKSIIECRGVGKSYEERVWRRNKIGFLQDLINPTWQKYQVLHNVSFNLRRGQRLAILGPNGAGKSTLIKILVGLQWPSSGNVKVLGIDPRSRPKNLYKKAAVIFGHKTSLWWDLPVQDSFYAAKEMYEIDNVIYETRKNQLVEALRLQNLLSKPVRELSLGERVKCEIATSLVQGPEVLFLDEPTIGLDIESKTELRRLLVEWTNQLGMSVVLTSHDMSDIFECCNTVMLLSSGSQRFYGSMQDLCRLLNVTGENMVAVENAFVEKFQEWNSET